MTALITKTPTQPATPTITPEKPPVLSETQVRKIYEWLLPSPRQKGFAWTADDEQFVVLPAGGSTGRPSGGVVMYDADTLSEIWRIEPQGITLYISSAAFSPDGKSLALYAGGIHIHEVVN